MTHLFVDIKKAFDRQPVFGDVAQISALKLVRAEEESREGKTEYKVTVEIEHSEVMTVWAEDKTEAEEMAREIINVDDADFWFTVKDA
jgi:hypothetical protein